MSFLIGVMAMRRACIAASVLILCTWATFAQERGSTEGDSTPNQQSASNGQPGGEIDVFPQEDPNEGVEQGEVPQPAFQTPPNPFPSLGDSTFRDFSSALRSTRSIFDDPRHATITNRNQLNERLATDMIDALQEEVGVLIQRTGRGQTSPFVRGLTGPQTLILVDGIRLNNSTFRFGPNQYFATIDPGQVERIEVVRGPQSVLWGSDAIGGVINVVTRSGDNTFLNNYGRGEFVQRFKSADSTSYSRVNVEGSLDVMSWFAGASYLNVRDLDRGGDLGRQPFTNYSQYGGDVKIDYLLDEDHLLTFSIQHSEQTDVPRTDRFPSEFRIFTPQQRDLGYVRLKGRLDGYLFDYYMITGSFQRQKEGIVRRRPPNSIQQDNREFDVETTGINFVLDKDMDELGVVTVGADWYHDEVDASAERVNLNTGDVSQRTPQFPTDSYYERFGTFLQWDVTVTEQLSFISGVRYSSIDLGATVDLFDPNAPGFPNNPPVATPIGPSFQDWTYSVGGVYALNPCLHLVGSVAEGFRAPGLDELTSVSDNVNEGVDIPTVDLRPEQSTNYEVGIKMDFDRFRSQAYYFWTDIDGLIDRVLVGNDPATNTDFFQRRNIANAQLDGFEFGSEFLLNRYWSIYGNLTYTLGVNVTDGEPVSRIPPTQGIVGIRWRDEANQNWFDVYGWLVRRQDRLSARDIRDSRIPAGGTPGYGTLNMRAGRQLTQNQRVSLWLENILDKAYRVHGSGVDGPGFSANLGYELHY